MNNTMQKKARSTPQDVATPRDYNDCRLNLYLGQYWRRRFMSVHRAKRGEVSRAALGREIFEAGMPIIEQRYGIQAEKA